MMGTEEKIHGGGLQEICIAVVVLGVMVLTASSVFGTGYTNVGPPAGGEASHAEILQDIYGGEFTADGVNYNNTAGITALRVFDFDGAETIRLNLLSDSLDGNIDQVWTDGAALVTAKAVWAGDSQSFGWNEGGLETTTYEELLTDADLDDPGVAVNIHGDFLWGYKPDGQNWWSLNSQNQNGEDHMVTYKVEGLAGPEVVWLIFMEDRPLDSADKDYNDFVVEITAVPEPATMLLLGIGGILLRKRK
jgi:hypothetical protein